MPTYIYSKKTFIEYLNKHVDDDTAIVFTGEVTGSLSGSKKKGIKITHQFAPDAFKDEGIGHIAFGKTTTLSILFADKTRLSDNALKIFETETK